MFCQLKIPEVMPATWGVVRTKVGDVVVMFLAELVTFAVGDEGVIDLVMSATLDGARVWTNVEFDKFKAIVVTFAVRYGGVTIGRILLAVLVGLNVTTTDGVIDGMFQTLDAIDEEFIEAVMFLAGVVTFIVGYGVGTESLLHDPDACEGLTDVDIFPAELVTFAIGYGGTCVCLPIVAVEAADVVFPDKLVEFTMGYRASFVGTWIRLVDALTVMFPADFVTFGMRYGGNATGRVMLTEMLPLDFVTFSRLLDPVVFDEGAALADMLPAALVTFFGIGYRGTGTGFTFALAEAFDEDVLDTFLVEFMTLVGYGGTGMGTRIGFLASLGFNDVEEDIFEEDVFVAAFLVELVTYALREGIGPGTGMGTGIGFIPAVDLATVEAGDDVLLILMLVDLPDFSGFGSDLLAVGSGARVFSTMMVFASKTSVICFITVLVSALVCI